MVAMVCQASARTRARAATAWTRRGCLGSPSGRRYLRVGVEVEALSGGLGGVDGHERSCQLEAWDGGELRRFDPGLGKLA